MRSVSIISAGISKFGENWDESYRQMVAKAALEALATSSVEGKEIEAIFGGTMASGRFIGQEHIGALIADQLGLGKLSQLI